MKIAVSLISIILAIILLSAVPVKAEILTNSWQIRTMTSSGTEKVQFLPTDTVYISVLPPASLSFGSVRVMYVMASNQTELARYTLGFYPAGFNQSVIPLNVTLPLTPYNLSKGDALVLKIVQSSTGITEFATAISVSPDIEALLKQQKDTLVQFFMTEIAFRDNEIYYLTQQLGQVQSLVYATLAGLAMLAALITKPYWHKKPVEEQEKVDTAFEAWLKDYISEREEPGDKK